MDSFEIGGRERGVDQAEVGDGVEEEDLTEKIWRREEVQGRNMQRSRSDSKC